MAAIGREDRDMSRTQLKRILGAIILFVFFGGLFVALAIKHSTLQAAFIGAVCVVIVKALVVAIDWISE